MYESLTTLYALRVLEGKTQMSEVPAKLKELVRARMEVLDKNRDEDGNIIYN